MKLWQFLKERGMVILVPAMLILLFIIVLVFTSESVFTPIIYNLF